MKYVILSDSDNIEPFTTPRQLIEINGEPLVKRTIRLLKENGIKDVIITSHDKRFDNLGATRYEPKFNEYRPKLRLGYWLDAFPKELLIEPITFLLGDVYYSEKAIKTIIEQENDSVLYFCTYKNKCLRYIKHHDEPLAFKVNDCNLFLEHINKLKKLKDEGKTKREPIAWELYRSINNIDVFTHIITTNCVIINDETCDIDKLEDIELLNERIGGNLMVKAKAKIEFSLAKFDELKNLVRYGKNENGKLFKGDTFECTSEMAEYLNGGNAKGISVIEILEIIPEVYDAKIVDETEIKVEPIKNKQKKSKKNKNLINQN